MKLQIFHCIWKGAMQTISETQKKTQLQGLSTVNHPKMDEFISNWISSLQSLVWLAQYTLVRSICENTNDAWRGKTLKTHQKSVPKKDWGVWSADLVALPPEAHVQNYMPEARDGAKKNPFVISAEDDRALLHPACLFLRTITNNSRLISIWRKGKETLAQQLSWT